MITKTTQIYGLLLAGVFSVMTVSLQPNLIAQTPAKAAGASGQVNLTKEVADKKDKIAWKAVQDNAIPIAVCTMLNVCGGPAKGVGLRPANESGVVVSRVLYLTQDQKHADVYLLFRQTPTDYYFFLLAPDGSLAKTAYAQKGATISWLSMGNGLAQPTFDKDKAVWHAEVAKVGVENKAAAPAAPSPQN
jgi:hypothetical protein